MIYSLPCSYCSVQYVDESTMSLYEKINSYKRAKSGCMHVVKNFKDIYVRASWSVQIIEIFPGTEYKNNKVRLVNRETIKRRADPNLPVGCSVSK